MTCAVIGKQGWLSWPDLAWGGDEDLDLPEPCVSCGPSPGASWAVSQQRNAMLVRKTGAEKWERMELPAGTSGSVVAFAPIDDRNCFAMLLSGEAWKMSLDAPAVCVRACPAGQQCEVGFALTSDHQGVWLVGSEWQGFELHSVHSGEILDRAPSPPWKSVNPRRMLSMGHRGRTLYVGEGTSWLSIDRPGASGWRRSAWLPGVESITLSGDGRSLVSWSSHMSPTIALWKTDHPETPRSIHGHIANVDHLMWSQNDRFLLSVDDEGFVRVWDADATPWSRVLPSASSNVHQVAFGPDGSVLLVSTAGEIARFAATSARAGETFEISGELLNSIALDTRQGRIAATSLGGALVVADAGSMSSNSPPCIVRDVAGELNSCAFSPDGSLLAVAGSRPGITLFRTDTLQPVQVIPEEGLRVSTVVFGPGGEWLAWRRGSSVIVQYLTDAGGASAGGSGAGLVGGRVVTLRGHLNNVRALRVSADGRRLYSCGDDRTVRIWDTSDWSCIRVTTRAREALVSMALHPSGRLIFGGGREGAVIVWDALTGKDVATIRSGGAIVMGLDCSPDGRTLAVASNTAGAMIWDLSVFASMVELNRTIVEAGAGSADPRLP